MSDENHVSSESKNKDNAFYDLDYGHDPDSMILEKHASSQIRQKVLKTTTIPEFNQFENILQQLYEMADRLVHILTTSSAKQAFNNNPQATKNHEF